MQISISSITITIFIFFFFFISQPPLSLSLNQEGLYLQTLKTSLSDPTNALSSWDPRHDSPCNWTGILCDPKTISVISIDLSSSNLNGPFPLILCRLHSLSFISFNDNYINSTLPPEISKCRTLKHLDLQMNYLVGTLPDTLPLLPELEYLDLSGNNFTGDVPLSFATFPKLKVFSLLENLITGEFPVFMFNVTSLTTLNASFNPMTPSRLTSKIDNLVNLECFWVANCSLIGDLPDSMRRLTKLQVLDVSYNQLSGRFPGWITEMVSLRQVEFYGNSFTGELPESGWEKMMSLRNFDASMNRISGTIPKGLARLPLKSLNMYENQLEGEIPVFIGDSPNLVELKLYSNKLTGELPRKLGENSPLIIIDLSTNKLTGELPPNLCKQVKLTNLLLMDNLFSGEIPSSYGECLSLLRVRLGGNRLSGSVPEKFWGLPHVWLLELMRNSLSGEISKSIAFASNLSIVRISDNSFTGEIPEEIGNATSMKELIANDNKLSGSIPKSMMKLEQLANLNLYNNDLSGEIPSEIKSKALSELSLGSNKLSGRIPSEFGSLTTLNYLDLSNNKLTGEVPNELQHLRLNEFNFSNNQLSGELPSFFAKRIYKESFLGNPGLCGDIEGLCDSRVEVKKQRYLWLLRSIFIVAAIVFIVGVVWFYFKYKSFKDVGKCTNDKSKWTLMSFHKLGFSEYEILDCLDEDNVIGTGASGKVYKAVLSNGEAVAVKKLWSHMNMNKVVDSDDIENGGGGGGCGDVKDNGFEAEVDTLGKIRHKNIVRLWCCCKTKDCKLLVYEYMPNGSLGDLLHGPKGGLLDWPTRYRIALDSAEGLSYLHHDCVPAIVHRDIKSNNILLDGEFSAKVADFGVAKVVDAIGKGTKSMSVIAGSCGYIAPEYAYTLRVNEKSDTYSFGVVILELVTGKRPVDPEYGEKDLVKWVCTTMDQKGVDHIIDPKLDSCYKEEVCKLLNIGLLCTSPLPINRPSMRRVVKMLQEISGEDILKTGKKDGKLTPYYYEEASDQGSAV